MEAFHEISGSKGPRVPELLGTRELYQISPESVV